MGKTAIGTGEVIDNGGKKGKGKQEKKVVQALTQCGGSDDI